MNKAAAILQRPELTMPDLEAAHLRAAYERAKVILEYGAGGSTVMAAEMPGKTVFSIETDQGWVDMMTSWFDQNPSPSQPEIIWSNIGTTKAWGRPANERHWREYAKYSLEFWSLEGIPHPDVMLVDGRFRAGCILAAAFRCTQPMTVLVDDYARRDSYHAVEKLVGAPRLIGRMAEFQITPTPIPSEHLLEIISLIQDPY